LSGGKISQVRIKGKLRDKILIRFGIVIQ